EREAVAVGQLEALAQHHLVEIAGADVLQRALDVGEELLLAAPQRQRIDGRLASAASRGGGRGAPWSWYLGTFVPWYQTRRSQGRARLLARAQLAHQRV